MVTRSRVSREFALRNTFADTLFTPYFSAIGLQLTETLHGILPITPEEDSSHYFENTILNEEDLSNSLYGSSTSNTTSQEDDEDAIEVISINPNNVEMEDFDDDDEEDDDLRSCSSRSTFRSRTDSSSIGDYESHSSDYDEDDIDEEVFEDNGTMNNKEDLLLPMNDIMAEDDAFDIDIDANTFDLATFIIQDDIPVVPQSQSKKIVIPKKDIVNNLDESDSDVDIETVEDAKPIPIASVMPEPDNELEEEISVPLKKDEVVEKVAKVVEEESLKLKESKKVESSSTPQPSAKPKSIPLVPNKRQRDFLKGKFGLGKGKGLGKGEWIFTILFNFYCYFL